MFILADSLVHLIDRIGVFVFALSGGMVAVRHRMDLLGVLIVSLFPAVGGGTLRDVLLDQPVFWLTDQISIMLALLAGFVAFFAADQLQKIKLLVWADAVGLALFGVVGASKAYSVNGQFVITVMMGTITACAGGVIRDVVCNERPMLLSEDVYATAVIGGTAIFWLARQMGVATTDSLLIGAGVIFIIRAAGIVFQLKLPKPPA